MRISVLIFLITVLLISDSYAKGSAVFIAYHRFGENKYPATNIRLGQFEQHIRELKSGPYTVLPVLKILSFLKNGKKLPKLTVGITIDDGYQSIYTEAWPRLKNAGLPFTVFVSTNSIDENRSNRLKWEQIREMKAQGVTFGAHTASHLHMINASQRQNMMEIFKSNSRFVSELGENPKIFAYPYGEASTKVMKVVSKSGYDYAFGQHSGAVNRTSDKYYLPRFALNEVYGNLNRFKLITNTLPLSISEFTPSNPVVNITNPPNVGFTITGNLKNLNQLSCYTNTEGKVSTTLLGNSRVEVRMIKPFLTGRNRLNCTLPGKNGRYYWLGALFLVPDR